MTPVIALDHHQTAPAWVDEHLPPRGNCGLCGAADSRHRELDAIVSRLAAGDRPRDLADDYDLPVRFIGRIARDLAHPDTTDTDRLARGEAVPGGPGACSDCHHARVWHQHRGKRPCERCDCASWRGAS